MHASTSNIRVVVRLPYNRPEELIPDPPRVEWSPEKEQILWEVIAKSRAVEGAGTDWKGLAAHLQVPLPYLLYRAQTRYEEDLRGLQGIRSALSPSSTSPVTQAQVTSTSTNTAKQPNGGEYFPRFPTTGEKPGIPRRDSLRTEGLGNGDMKSSIMSPGGRPPMGVRARLSSLGSVQAVARSRRLSTLSNTAAKRILSSSTATLQGPKRPREMMRPLSPTSSHPSPENSTSPDASSEDEEDSNDEQRAIDEQETLRLKLENLQKLMTADALGLVASPSRMSASRYSEKGRRSEYRRGRDRPLSSSSSGQLPRLETLSMTRRHNANHTPSHHSLSSASASSPQGSIPSIPSPPPETLSNRPTRRQTPLHARPLSQPGKSTSPPPSISPNSAWGQNVSSSRSNHFANVGRTKLRGDRSERGSEVGSSTSSLSFEELPSDASITPSLMVGMESASMSNTRASSSRFSSRNHFSRIIR
ncbi:hypothetical protein QCA50_000891 [Cerrena zonata]|uniref:Atg29 N-terminal domain-containing protein n=1 Tax=Cerrena zonata TaxID=2478898 RepID=A0AAW0GRN6_9APHY